MRAVPEQTLRLRKMGRRFRRQADTLDREATAEHNRGNTTLSAYLRARAAGLRAAAEEIDAEVGA